MSAFSAPETKDFTQINSFHCYYPLFTVPQHDPRKLRLCPRSHICYLEELTIIFCFKNVTSLREATYHLPLHYLWRPRASCFLCSNTIYLNYQFQTKLFKKLRILLRKDYILTLIPQTTWACKEVNLATVTFYTLGPYALWRGGQSTHTLREVIQTRA